MGKREKSTYMIQSVLHALKVLEEFDGDTAEFGVTELSKRLRLHKNNVFRLLATLEMAGYIEQNNISESYRLGLKALRLGQAYLEQMGFVKQARPVLEEVVRECNETAYVGVIREHAVVYLDVVEAAQVVRVATRVGWRLPIHCSAIGKAQLAYKSEAQVEKMCQLDDLKVYTPKTIVNREAFLAELAEIREAGYAVDNEEYEPAIKCVGAPVRDYTGQTVGGISITGPFFRLTDQRMENDIIPLAVRAADEISRRLGFRAENKLT